MDTVKFPRGRKGIVDLAEISAQLEKEEVTAPEKMKEKPELLQSEGPELHTVIRRIALSNRADPRADLWSMADVDAYITTWLRNGWNLISTHYLGSDPSAWMVMYILVHA